ncbi:MAG: hypothetical protein F6K18_06405 [Okeania sp. SIO2C2]|uniref:hypothetical protein n=1 Tax=Okeania sp. SIO2C2 TaxID=2607787 RepID=UPI0013B70F55|nr:hypothetical protein [Okeania sp. SIO2C2]NEP86486.1 hypothetical protein [Okeania sp. SIO2C2]
MKKAEGRRQKAEGRRENYLWIVFDKPLRVYKPQTILSTPVDGGVLYQIPLNSYRMVKLGGVSRTESGRPSQDERELQR